MNITLIAAMGSNGIIAMNDKIPWMGQLPRDMHHFRSLTLGKTVVMGRKTFESMGRPLPDRTNIVLTRNSKWVAPDGVTVVTSSDEIMQLASDGKEIMIIGGAEIYSLFLPFARTIELTIIGHEFDGDVFFPLINSSINSSSASHIWKIVRQMECPADEKNLFALTFLTLEST